MITEMKIFKTGFCVHPDFVVIKKGSFRKRKFPAIFALMKHEKLGYVLLDSGYAPRFFSETKKFPYNIYAAVTPVSLEKGESARELLEAEGVSPDKVKYIIISHFHADHISGLKDFPKAQFIYDEAEYSKLKGKKGFAALRKAFIPGLMPEDFESRSSFFSSGPPTDVSNIIPPFSKGLDIFSDGSVIMVELPGHTPHQAGALVNYRGELHFFVSDACWLSHSYREMIPPSRLAYLIMDNKKKYLETLSKIHRLHKKLGTSIRIIPTHCDEIAVHGLKNGYRGRP